MKLSEWSTLIGRDCRDTVFSLVELDYADAKVYAITTHLKACKMGVFLYGIRDPFRAWKHLEVCCYGKDLGASIVRFN